MIRLDLFLSLDHVHDIGQVSKHNNNNSYNNNTIVIRNNNNNIYIYMKITIMLTVTNNDNEIMKYIMLGSSQFIQ